MNWDVVIISLLAGSLVVTGSFFVGAWFFAFKKRSHRFGIPMGIVMATAGFLSVFINPITNVMLGVAIGERRLASIRQECIGRPMSALQEQCGTPDGVWSNEYGVFISWRNTSPFFSMWQEDTMALVSNGVTVKIWTDD